MFAMGLITGEEPAEEVSPVLPSDMLPAWEKYRGLKFMQRVGEDGRLVLHPRDALTWAELVAYGGVTGDKITPFESDLIMGLDAIFEGREYD